MLRRGVSSKIGVKIVSIHVQRGHPIHVSTRDKQLVNTTQQADFLQRNVNDRTLGNFSHIDTFTVVKKLVKSRTVTRILQYIGQVCQMLSKKSLSYQDYTYIVTKVRIFL